MTLEQHDTEVRVSESLRHSSNLRNRLLHELDVLEHNLRTVREVAESLPEPQTPSSYDKNETHHRFWPWK